jgi:hypothetical protein
MSADRNQIISTRPRQRRSTVEVSGKVVCVFRDETFSPLKSNIRGALTCEAV